MPVQGASVGSGSTCKVYSLAELGDDPKLCKWIADTIPDVIQPATWRQVGVKITYFAPAKVLVINHSGAVHAQVDRFLQDLKKSMPPAKADGSGVTQAQFAVPDNRPVGPASPPQGYPVPYPPAAPKHLFHFIIRYEGAGIVDSNVVNFMKAQNADRASSGTYPMQGPESKASPATPVVGVSNPPSTPMMPPADPLVPSQVPPLASPPPLTLPPMPARPGVIAY
jgi:hypothetical protein